jgi:hypothetical protein
LLIKVRYFDNVRVDLVEGADQPDTKAMSALAAFLELTSADRVSDSRHVFAYFRDCVGGIHDSNLPDEITRISDNPADIWQHMTPSKLFLEHSEDDAGEWFVVIEAECAWEEEHGLMMVWRSGKVLNKVGGYDGHVTNVHAFDDDSLVDVVYAASNPDYTTRLSPSLGSK